MCVTYKEFLEKNKVQRYKLTNYTLIWPSDDFCDVFLVYTPGCRFEKNTERETLSRLAACGVIYFG